MRKNGQEFQKIQQFEICDSVQTFTNGIFERLLIDFWVEVVHLEEISEISDMRLQIHVTFLIFGVRRSYLKSEEIFLCSFLFLSFLEQA